MFRFTLRRFSAFSVAAASSAGLMPQQHQALLAIKAMSADMAPSIGDVAEQLLIRHHSAVELVNRLVRMELVHRYRDPADRRRVRISLTPLAEEKLATLANVHLEELRAVRPLLTKLLRHFSN
ncbi:MAG TPA: helix-turn-helix domain-containing protein [Pusillimonas sp.]